MTQRKYSLCSGWQSCFPIGHVGEPMTHFLTVTANRWGEKQGSLPRGLVKLSLFSLEEIKPCLPRWKPICCYAFSVHLADPLRMLNEDHSCYLCCVQRLSRHRGKGTKENNPARWLHLQQGWMVADVNCIHTALEEEECFSLPQSFVFGSVPLYNHVHIVTQYGALPSLVRTMQGVHLCDMKVAEHFRGSATTPRFSAQQFLLYCNDSSKHTQTFPFWLRLAPLPFSYQLIGIIWSFLAMKSLSKVICECLPVVGWIFDVYTIHWLSKGKTALAGLWFNLDIHSWRKWIQKGAC